MLVRSRAILLVISFVAATLFAAFPSTTHAATQKVVIIVGPVGATTASYRARADAIAVTATAAGATVVKVYSPNATWANVRAAVNGANVIVYLGHGNGFPNPYSSVEYPDRVNGWGLNRVAGTDANDPTGDGDDWSKSLVYCGEKALLGTLTSADGAAQRQYCAGGAITPAANFVMVYSNACYAPGAGEARPAPSQGTALARVANYSTPILRLGGSYFATDLGSAKLVDLILRRPTTANGAIFELGSGYSEPALRRFRHPGVASTEVWIQRTNTSLGDDYWFAFAGRPTRTPSGATVSYSGPGVLDPPQAGLAVVRFGGADRFAAAAAVSRANFAAGVPVAYVATGFNFPDALAGGVAAARNGGPVLLVSPGSIPPATATELNRLRPGRIVILGGPASVSSAVASGLDRYTTGSITRHTGADRYASAAAISAATFAPGVPVAYLATGENFPDALAGISPAVAAGGPILLLQGDSIPAPTATELRRLRPARIVVLGGPASVSDRVLNGLDAYAPDVTRISGSDRYSAAAAISRATFAAADTVYIATGTNFPDALAGGPVAAAESAPLLLVPKGAVPGSVLAEVRRLDPSRLVILGGTTSVPQSTVDALVRALGG